MTKSSASRSIARDQVQHVTLLLIGNVILGVLVPVVLSKLSKGGVSVTDGAILALLVILVLSTGEALVSLEQLRAMRTKDYDLWSQRTGIDTTIGEIRSGLHQLVADDDLRDSFYVDHYRRELELLQSRVHTTITTKEVLLDRHHIDSTEVLLSIFDRPEHKNFFATHVLADVGDVFDVTYEVYFFAWLDRLKAGKVEMRRLFIYGDAHEFDHPNVRKLVAWHNSKVPGLEAKAISRTEFQRFKADYLILDGVEDIGIFSNQYIYLGQTRRGENISGHFSRDSSLIAAYTSLFEALWKSRVTSPLTSFVSESISADELFDRAFTLSANVKSGPQSGPAAPQSGPAAPQSGPAS